MKLTDYEKWLAIDKRAILQLRLLKIRAELRRLNEREKEFLKE